MPMPSVDGVSKHQDLLGPHVLILYKQTNRSWEQADHAELGNFDDCGVSSVIASFQLRKSVDSVMTLYTV